jgi:hypothetical protein
MKKITVILGLFLWNSVSFAQINFPIQASKDGHYFIDNAQKPVFLCGDTPWQLIVDLKKSEAEEYFEARKKQGYNAILVDILSEEKEIKQVDCQCNPFGKENFVDMNEAYFDHAEWVVQTAQQKGFVVLLTVAYWGCCSDEEGWRNELIATTSLPVLEKYGAYLGKRFAKFKNLIWVLGGDASKGKEKFEAIQEGIRSQDPKSVFTYHTREDELASEHHIDLTYNGVYAYTSDRIYRLTERGYMVKKTMPIIYTEGFYDDLIGSGFHGWNWTPTMQSHFIHHQMYTFLLSGGLGGFINGHLKMWSFPNNWREYINGTNSPAMIYFYEFVNRIKWWTLQPDFDQSKNSVISSNRGKYGGSQYIPVATSKADGLLIAFIPATSDGSQRTFTINYAKFKPKSGYWLNPANGQREVMQSIPANGTFTAPRREGTTSDWVLVLQK